MAYNSSTYEFSRPLVGETIFHSGEKVNLGAAYPGKDAPSLQEYGVDLTRIESAPSYSSAPVPAPTPRQEAPVTDATLGAVGTPIFSGFVRDLGEYNPKLDGRTAFTTYEKMRRSDADVAAGLMALKLPIRAAEKQILPGVDANSPDHDLAKEIADFVRDNIFTGLESKTSTGTWTTQSFEKVEENALLSLDFGCAGHEDIWAIDGDKVRLVRMAPRLPTTYYRYWSLALDTPVPTPNGWTTVGKIKVGDEIFDDRGVVQKVTGKSEVFVGRKCYRLTFKDGSTIVSDADHRWMTQSHYERGDDRCISERKIGSIKTTKEIADTLYVCHGKGSNHTIPTCGPVQYSEKKLSIDPYVLGAWLGDGAAARGHIAAHVDDAQEMLDAMGVGNNKHVPEIYLRASVAQRRALLAGLMDTDGSISGKKGLCKFTNTNRNLIDSVLELLRSLGEIVQEPKIRIPKAGEFGRKPYWVIQFYPSTCPFHLKRKVQKFKSCNIEDKRNYHKHYVIAADHIESQPTQCLMVSGDSHLFLVGRSFIATHNTEEDGETLLAIEQWGYRKNNFINVVVPAEKFCLFVHQQEGSNFYGRSVLRAAYQSWWVKSQLYKIDSIALERNAQGVPTFTMPEGYSEEDKRLAAIWSKNLITHEQTGLSLPPGWKFEINGIKGRLRDPWQSIRHHSEQIVRSMLAMFMTLGTTATGSRALGSTFLDFFFLSLEANARNIADTISNNTIRRLVDYNYTAKSGKTLPYPKLHYSSIVVLDPIEVAGAVRDLANSQTDILQPDDELENYLRRKFGLPVKTHLRPRFLPVNTRIMEAPVGEQTIAEMESSQGEVESIDDSKAGTGSAAGTIVSQGNKVRTSTTPKPKGAIPGVEPMKRPSGKGKVAPPPTGSQTFSELDDNEIGASIFRLLMSEGNGDIISVDFDGTLASHSHDKDKAGAPIPAGIQLVKDLHERGYLIIVFTARTNRQPVKDFLAEHDIPHIKVTNVKDPRSVGFIDDRAIPVSSDNPKSYRKALKRVKKLKKESL